VSDRKTLTRSAIRAALEVRRRLQISPADPVCPIDVAELLGVTVRFTDEAPSMEGMYFNAARPTILVCALRPIGRQAMTCAHELAHHVFGHGTKVDEYLGQGTQQQASFEPDEWVADRFANFLLMPKAAVLSAFRSRGIDERNPDPRSGFIVAGQLGVGYEALIHHLMSSLGCMAQPMAEALRKYSPKQIRTELVGPDGAKSDVVVVDAAWLQRRPIDLQVGDQALLPPGSRVEGHITTTLQANGDCAAIRATRPGIARVYNADSGWACFVRITRRQYVGLARYRHLEDLNDD